MKFINYIDSFGSKLYNIHNISQIIQTSSGTYFKYLNGEESDILNFHITKLVNAIANHQGPIYDLHEQKKRGLKFIHCSYKDVIIDDNLVLNYFKKYLIEFESMEVIHYEYKRFDPIVPFDSNKYSELSHEYDLINENAINKIKNECLQNGYCFMEIDIDESGDIWRKSNIIYPKDSYIID